MEEENYNGDINYINLQECECCHEDCALLFDPDFPHLRLAILTFECRIYCDRCLKE